MLRVPTPATGMPLDAMFARALLDAMQLNPAVHDGAVMLGRDRAGGVYKVAGWSYRLYPDAIERALPNRGSAFNSCLAMSARPDVDRLYLVGGDDLLRFVAGQIEFLLAR